MTSSVGKWLEVVEEYYLRDFIASGGAAFKLLLTRNDDEKAEALDGLRDIAGRNGYFHAAVSAAESRVDRIEQIFFAMARQIQWERLAAGQAAELLRSLDYVIPEGARLDDKQAIAEASGRDVDDLIRDINRATKRQIDGDHRMCKEFRAATARLSEAQFFPNNVSPSNAETIVGWFQGAKVGLKMLRDLGIYSRIDRHNARDILRASAHWLTKSGTKGLVLFVDLSELLVVRPRKRRGDSAVGLQPDEGRVGRHDPVDHAEPLRYTQPQFLDTCEVLRQFIDDTDEISHCLICCVGPSELETAEGKRSLFTYLALQNRLVNEVHDRDRPNLLAAMVRSADTEPHGEGGQNE